MQFHLSGELDLGSAPHLNARLKEYVAESGSDVVVDAKELSFVDISGCRVLVDTAKRLPTGRRLVLVHAPSFLVRLLSLCGWLDSPGLVVASR